MCVCVCVCVYLTTGFPDGSAGEESACNAGDTEDAGLIPGLGRASGEGRIPWTEEPGRLQSMGSQRVGHD